MVRIGCDGEGNGTVTDKICCERREALKSEAWARAEAIQLATQYRDERIERLEERYNQLVLLALGQLIAFILGIIGLVFVGKL